MEYYHLNSTGAANLAALLRADFTSAHHRAVLAQAIDTYAGDTDETGPAAEVAQSLAHTLNDYLHSNPEAQDNITDNHIGVRLLVSRAVSDAGGDPWGTEQNIKDYRSDIQFIADHLPLPDKDTNNG